MVDYVEVALLASSVFFATIAFGLLYRYRQVSQQITKSSDLGRDLWQSLEQRLKKQDERIVDVMARFEVVQTRVLNPPSAQVGSVTHRSVAPAELDVAPEPERVRDAPVMRQPVQKTEGVVDLRRGFDLQLDETQIAAMRLLAQRDMNTRQITNELRRSREHTARIMKELFEAGLVTRDDSQRPFVYKLTDDGRGRLT